MRLASRRGQSDLPSLPLPLPPSPCSSAAADIDEGLGSRTDTPGLRSPRTPCSQPADFDDLYSLDPAMDFAPDRCPRARAKSLLEKVLPKSLLKGFSPASPPELPPLYMFPALHDPAIGSPAYLKQEPPLPPSQFTASLAPPTSPLAPPPLATDSALLLPLEHHEKYMSMEDIIAQMNVEDAAFHATEQRLVESGWSSELEIENIRRLRSDIRKIWEDRISEAKVSGVF